MSGCGSSRHAASRMRPARRRSPASASRRPARVGGRGKAGAQLDRFLGERARRGAVGRLEGERLGRQQHRPLAPIGVAVEEPAAIVALERFEGARPVAVGAMEIERRLAGPGERRRRLGGLLGEAARRHRVVAALRLDEEPAQPEQLRLRLIRHGAKRRIGAVARTGQLRGLRLQQQRQRLVGGMPRRLVGVLERGAQIAGADGDEAPGDGVMAPGGTPLRRPPRQPRRRVHEIDEERPRNQRRADDGEDAPDQYGERGIGVIAEPIYGDLARPVGEPSRRESQPDGDEQKDDEPDHRLVAPAGAPSLVKDAVTSCAEAATAAWRAKAFLRQGSAIACTGAGSRSISPSTPARSRRAMSRSMRPITVAASSPGRSPTGRMRTSFSAWACRRSR